MADLKVRRQIALLAARLMYERLESEYYTAKRKAAREVGAIGGGRGGRGERFRAGDLPSNAEVREQLGVLAGMMEGEGRGERLREMRVAALGVMRLLAALEPRLIGSVLTGHVRRGSDIDLHVFTDHVSAVTTVLEDAGVGYGVERKRVVKRGEERVFTHVHLQLGEWKCELTVYEAGKVNYPFKSSITGKVIERASIAELEGLIRETYPGVEVGEEEVFGDRGGAEGEGVGIGERFERFEALLVPLEKVRQDARFHPEGDALYHSLQVFELAREAAGYDEEFLLAALLHDVGKGIDAGDHVGAGLEALEGLVTERTRFLIEHHMEAHELADGKLGFRAAERLRGAEHSEELMLLQELDRKGRRVGAQVPTVKQALGFVRHLAEENERWGQ